MNQVRRQSVDARVERERAHGRRVLESNESNWGWRTPAGAIRKTRRSEFLCAPVVVDRPNVLEIGCGSGTFTGELRGHFEDLTAIDVADDLLEVARKRHPGVRFEAMDAHRTRFEDDAFDLVLGCSVLHHLDWARALKEFHRILVPGGVVRFSEPNLLNPQIFVQKNWPWLKDRLGDSPDEYAFTRWQILRDLRAAGFEEAKAEPYEFLHPSVPERLIDPVLRVEAFLERTVVRHIAGSLKISAKKAG